MPSQTTEIGSRSFPRQIGDLNTLRLLVLSEEKIVPLENLLSPEILRQVSFTPPVSLSRDTLGEKMRELGARNWQVELTAQLIVDAFILAKTAPVDQTAADLPASDEHEEL